MKARATKESSYVSRERQARPLPQRLDRVIHDRTRLAILAALAASETLSFTDLKSHHGHDGRESERARAQARGCRLRDVREDVCRPHPADGVPAERGRTAGVREVSRPHGRAHQGDAEEIDPAAHLVLHSYRESAVSSRRLPLTSRRLDHDRQPVCANGVAMSTSAAPNTGQLNAVGST